MIAARPRRARWIALGLVVAVIGTDVGVLLARGPGPSRAAYLRFVRGQAAAAFEAVAPSQRLVTALEFENAPTLPSVELYSARDAFADPAPAAAVRSVSRRLRAAGVPGSLRGENQQLYDAASTMAGVLSDFASMSTTPDPGRLGREFVGGVGKKLESSERQWSATLRQLFSAQDVPPTLDPDSLPEFAPTLVTWTFNSDLACWNDVLEVQAHEHGSGPSSRALTKIAQAYRDAAYHLRDVALPQGAPPDLRTGIAGRIGGLDDLAHVLATWARLHHFPKFLAARARQAVSRLDALSRTYDQYRVHACASLTSLRARSPFGPLPGPTVQT